MRKSKKFPLSGRRLFSWQSWSLHG